MAQLDDDVGLVMQKIKDLGEDDNTIVLFTTDNGTEVFTWPDGGQTPFTQSRGTVLEGGFRVPCDPTLAGSCAGRRGAERHIFRSGLVADICWPLPAIRTSPTNCCRERR